MQLNDKPGALRLGLMAAACSLLSSTLPAKDAPRQSKERATKVDAGVLYYGEDGGRIKSYGAVVDVRHDFGDEHVLSTRVSVDSLTGGSPNGAVPTRNAQTFATPSGTSLQASSGTPVTYTTASGRTVAQLEKVTLYTTPARVLPLDPSFKDKRGAIDLGWSQPLGSRNRIGLGGHFSYEHDFLSTSGNLSLSRDFNNKNTTVGLGVNAEQDQVKPVGGAPVAGSNYALLKKGGDKKKQVKGAQLGVTQVVKRNWITQVNVGVDRSNGYLTDPYKIISQVNAAGGVTGYLFERRPEERTRRSVYWGNKIAFGRDVLDASYRHGLDSWGIKTDTVDARYRFTHLHRDIYLEPHLRWYRQGKADFYSLFLNNASGIPNYMTSDPRLGAFTGKTVGMKLGLLLVDEQELTFRVEGYEQDPVQRSSTLAGLAGLDLNPRLRSVLFQVNYRFGY